MCRSRKNGMEEAAFRRQFVLLADEPANQRYFVRLSFDTLFVESERAGSCFVWEVAFNNF